MRYSYIISHSYKKKSNSTRTVPNAGSLPNVGSFLTLAPLPTPAPVLCCMRRLDDNKDRDRGLSPNYLLTMIIIINKMELIIN